MDRCIYDPYDDCHHDCPTCPQATEEPDIDYLRDAMNERE